MDVKKWTSPFRLHLFYYHVLGFTLIEMLLAVTIFSMIIGIIFTSFRVGSRSWERGEYDIDRFQKIRAISELMYREIRSTFPYLITPSEVDTHKKFYAFFGESESLKFVSFANLYRMYGGLSFVGFWVDQEKGLMVGEEMAVATNYADLMDISLKDEERSMIIDPDVKQMRLRYFDRKKKDVNGEWINSWDPRDKSGRDLRMPRFIEVQLIFDMENEEEFKETLIVPIETTVHNP